MIVDISKKILIVGLGLLGGSYARVLKRFGFDGSPDFKFPEEKVAEINKELFEILEIESDVAVSQI